ncbi:MAG: hypothetical protein WBN11_13830 [Eudoraea sp.]|uniref:hypothetical protein n=1 Tax=Eudoraea sp. TaxID=1979955 RepID=UPI003C745ED3
MNRLQAEIGKNQHTREARRIEQILSKKRGVNYVSISASGVMQIEWDANKVNQSDLIRSLKKLGLNIIDLKIDDTQAGKEEGHNAHSSLHILGENTELYFAIISGVCWILGVVFSFTPGAFENITTTLFIIGAVFGGVFTFITAARDLLRGKFEIDFLMLFAAIGAAALGKW